MGGNLRVLFYFTLVMNSELNRMDLVSGKRELCPILFQCQWVASHWPAFSVPVVAGPCWSAHQLLPTNRACCQSQEICSF